MTDYIADHSTTGHEDPDYTHQQRAEINMAGMLACLAIVRGSTGAGELTESEIHDIASDLFYNCDSGWSRLVRDAGELISFCIADRAAR